MAEQVHRRGFLMGSAALLAACTQEGEGTLSGADPSENPSTSPTGPAGSQPGATGIDLGPALTPGVPRSLTTSDRQELDVELNLLAGELPTDWHGFGHWIHALSLIHI